MSLCILLFYFISHVEHTGVSIFWLDWEELEINRFNGSMRSRMERSPQIRDLSMRNPVTREAADPSTVSGWQLRWDCWEKDTLRTTRAARDAPSQLGSLWHLATFVSSAHAHFPRFGLQFQEQICSSWIIWYDLIQFRYPHVVPYFIYMLYFRYM